MTRPNVGQSPRRQKPILVWSPRGAAVRTACPGQRCALVVRELADARPAAGGDGSARELEVLLTLHDRRPHQQVRLSTGLGSVGRSHTGGGHRVSPAWSDPWLSASGPRHQPPGGCRERTRGVPARDLRAKAGGTRHRRRQQARVRDKYARDAGIGAVTVLGGTRDGNLGSDQLRPTPSDRWVAVPIRPAIGDDVATGEGGGRIHVGPSDASVRWSPVTPRHRRPRLDGPRVRACVPAPCGFRVQRFAGEAGP